MSMTLRNPEYRYFIYQTWQPDEVWCSLSSLERLTAPQARRYFWQKAENRILADLQALLDEGWQPADPIGPEAMRVRRIERVQFGIDLSDVFLWFITLGAALLIQLLLDAPRCYTIYQPLQFRLRLKRRMLRPLLIEHTEAAA